MIGVTDNGILRYERKAGGAPFNVACAAKKFGAKTLFFGSVGEDLIGEYLSRYAENMLGDGARIKRIADKNTTLAFVDIDAFGERSFCFYRKSTADMCLEKLDDQTIKSATILHVGSLMLSEERGLLYAEELMERARALSVPVSFDVNFRSDIFKDTDGAVSVYKKIIALADIVKFSEDEVEIFGNDYLETELKNKLVIITLGKEGSEWRVCGRSAKVESIPVKPVDTTGAGDAFYAGVLSVLDRKGLETFSPEDLNGALRFGNVCGALNTLSRGAIDGLPTLDEINKYL